MNVRLNLSLLMVSLAWWGPGGQDACAQTNANAADASSPTTLAASKLKVRAGLRMEMVAGSSLVESPAAMAFDERGRLFVAELRDYPAAPAGETLSGRVRLLEDSDGDGVFDTSVVFADHLDRPSAIACSRGGVFVAGPSGLSFLLDLDGDGIADLNRPLLHFSVSPTPEDPDEFPHAMRWGPDRRIYVALPAADGEVQDLRAPNSMPLKLGGGGFSFDPLTLGLRGESGADVIGQAFDEAGRRFVLSSSAALAVTVLNGAQLQRNPYAPFMPASAVLVPSAGGPLDCLIYAGNGYPTNLQGRAFIADPVSGAVDLITLRAGKTHPTAVAEEGSLRVPLVSGHGTSFRPMQLVSGPDDYLYIADLDRAVYPGGAPLSEAPDAGEVKSSGRIWRLMPGDRSAPAVTPPDFSTGLSLATALGSSNAWVRGTAARLLVERHPTNAVHSVREVQRWAKEAEGRREALRALNAAGSITVRDLTRAIRDSDPTIRTTGIGMFEGWVKGGRMPGALWDLLQWRATDRSAEVCLQVALALGSVRVPPSSRLLADLYVNNSRDIWMRRAMLTASPGTLPPLFTELLGRAQVRQAASGRELLRGLAGAIGLGGERQDVSACLGALADLNVPIDLAFPIVDALADGLDGRGLRLPDADDQGYWPAFATAARGVVVGGGDAQLRSDAVKVLGACVSSNFVADDYLLLLFAPGLPQPMQVPTMQALARQGLNRDFEALAQRWHLWDSPEQAATLDVLLQSEPGVNALLAALADKTIPSAALTSVHMNLLRNYPVDEIRARAIRLFGTHQPNRDALVNSFLGAADLPGSTARGQALFEARCAGCHQTGSRSFGPPLEVMRSRSAMQLVEGLVDPSREIAPGYGTTVLRLRDGRLVWGVARDLNAEVVQLTTRSGTRRYLSDTVVTFRPAWSLMPDNTSAGLTRRDVADVVSFIRSGR